MAGLLSEMNLREREEPIEAVAAGTKALLEPDMTRDGELTFPQEAHVVLARRTR